MILGSLVTPLITEYCMNKDKLRQQYNQLNIKTKPITEHSFKGWKDSLYGTISITLLDNYNSPLEVKLTLGYPWYVDKIQNRWVVYYRNPDYDYLKLRDWALHHLTNERLSYKEGNLPLTRRLKKRLNWLQRAGL